MRWIVIIAALAGCARERALPACDDCEAQGVHPAGYADEASAAFHGNDLERRGWDLALCQKCHGQDFAGNATAPSCLTCHAESPTACKTCHGDPPATAAHAAHLTQGLSCTDCHDVPATWDAHRRPTNRTAMVTFGELARHGGATPSWDGARCSGVYCHGATLADAAATSTRPLWTGGPAEAACGTCHGKPPASHAQSECQLCHRTSHHVDGVVDVGSGCAGGCHGDAQSAAPPNGLHGEQAPTELAVGAHRAHLRGGFFSGPIACNECHRVPTSVNDPGHLDSAAPAELAFGALASADGAVPAWDRATGTCTSVYCHGAGARLLGDTSPVRLVATSWTGTGAANAYCGSCHGLPPTTAPHTAAMQVTDCATCHAATVSAFGNILVAGGKHINGVVDAN